MQLVSCPAVPHATATFPEAPSATFTAARFAYSNALMLFVSDCDSFGAVVQVSLETDPEGNQCVEQRVVHGYSDQDDLMEALASSFAKPYLEGKKGLHLTSYSVFVSLGFSKGRLESAETVRALQKWLHSLGKGTQL